MRISIKAMGTLEWLLFIFLAILWGGSFFSGKAALAELQPFTLVSGRVSSAAITLNFRVIANGQRMPSSSKMWDAFPLMGLLNNLIPSVYSGRLSYWR